MINEPETPALELTLCVKARTIQQGWTLLASAPVMADKDLSDFPDISKKVAAPTKKSIFERQKAEAEAKRVRDQVEAAAIYDDFVKSFEDDGSAAPEIPDGPRRSGPGSLGPPPSAPTGPGRRHFGVGMKKSGPGTLGPPQTIKREYDEDYQGLFAYGDGPSYGCLLYTSGRCRRRG